MLTSHNNNNKFIFVIFRYFCCNCSRRRPTQSTRRKPESYHISTWPLTGWQIRCPEIFANRAFLAASSLQTRRKSERKDARKETKRNKTEWSMDASLRDVLVSFFRKNFTDPHKKFHRPSEKLHLKALSHGHPIVKNKDDDINNNTHAVIIKGQATNYPK